MGVFYGKERQPIDASMYVVVAASQTTQQISPRNSGSAVGDYLERIVVIPATTGQAACTIFDGTTAICAVAAAVTAATQIPPYAVDIGVTASSTKGFNVTTGAAVSILVVGRFSN